MNPQDFSKGYALYCAQRRAGSSGDALLTVQKLTARNHCPALFFSLEAGLLADEKQWREAWGALQRGGFVDLEVLNKPVPEN